MANNNFTLSEKTNRLLAIYRDFNRVASELWEYFKPEEREGGPIKDADDVAENRFKPYTNSVNDINAKLLAEISGNIADAIMFGDEKNVI